MRKVQLHRLTKPGKPLQRAVAPAHQSKPSPYNYRWQQQRLRFIKENPFCVMCLPRGLYVAATVVDHIIPHEGNDKLMWDQKNWQSLCATCHSSTKQSKEWADRGTRNFF